MVMPSLNRLKMRLVIAEHTMPPWLLQPLNLTRTIAAVTRNFKLSIYEIQMVGKQGEASIAYIGPGHELKFIASLAGKTPDELNAKDEISIFNIDAALEAMRSIYDIIVVELPQKMLRRLPSDSLITAPWFNWHLDTRRSWTEIEAGFHKDALENIRKMDKIESQRTYDQVDFDNFYHNIYMPYIKNRFGALARPPAYETMHYCFQRGWLDFYTKDKEVLGGGISYIAADILHNHVLGFKPDISSKERSQVSTARYYYSIQTAVESNCTALNFAQTRPILNDGIARYKRKWGAHVSPDPSQNWGFWIGLGCDLDRASHFLIQHTWIWLNILNRPHGLIIENNSAPLSHSRVNKICKRLWNPGLQSIVLQARGGFDSNVDLSLASPFPALGPATEWTPDN